MNNLTLTDLIKKKTKHTSALQLDQTELCFILNHALALHEDKMLHSYKDIGNLSPKLLAELMPAL